MKPYRKLLIIIGCIISLFGLLVFFFIEHSDLSFKNNFSSYNAIFSGMMLILICVADDKWEKKQKNK